MSELDVFFKNMSESLKILSEGISVMADKLDKMTECDGTKTKSEKAPEDVPKDVIDTVLQEDSDESELAVEDKEKTPKKKKVDRKPRSSSDTEIVLQVIRKQKNGIDMDALKDKTGFDGKKLANIVYRLKKMGKVESPAKGTYVKV